MREIARSTVVLLASSSALDHVRRTAHEHDVSGARCGLSDLEVHRHRTVAALIPRLAALAVEVRHDHRWSWAVDGMLIPTATRLRRAPRTTAGLQSADPRAAARLMANCILGRWPGNRNDRIYYRGSRIEKLCKAHRRVRAEGGYRAWDTPRRWRAHRRRRARVEHAIARLKDWPAARLSETRKPSPTH